MSYVVRLDQPEAEREAAQHSAVGTVATEVLDDDALTVSRRHDPAGEIGGRVVGASQREVQPCC